MKLRPFRYMSWAKAHYFAAEVSLVPSGMPHLAAEELEIPAVEPFQEVVCEGPGTLQQWIAGAYGAPREGVLACHGSTQAAHHLLAAMLDPGDEILVESPCYELFACLASLQGLGVRSFERSPAASFDLDPDRVAAAITDRTRLVVFTTVHNPTGRMASPDALRAIGETCARHGILGLASEVYLDFAPGTTTTTTSPDVPVRPPAALVHPSLVSTNSLTKVYGLGSVRTGWIIAQPDVIERCYEVRNIVAPLLPALPVAVASAALAARERLLARAHRAATAGRAALEAFFAAQDGFELCPPQAGIMSFVRVLGVADTMRFADYLREQHGVGVVPGEHFGTPGWLRVGYGNEPAVVRDGLARLARGREAYLALS